MNRLFTAWIEQVYHRRVHSETDQAPIERWMAGAPFPQPTAAALSEAFRWSEHRTVAKTATVSLHSNTYNVEPALVGRKVELVYDPFDLTDIEVRFNGKAFGKAIPHTVARHSHPKARPENPEPEPVAATGIDYLRLIDTERTKQLGKAINYTTLIPDAPATEAPPATAGEPGQPAG